MSKPGDHPDFFRFPAPAGRSRESQIRLDANCRFWLGDEPIAHPKMQQAFARWIQRHPDNGRIVLSNGYDWTYIQVDDVPFAVTEVRERDGRLLLTLSDGEQEALTEQHRLRLGKAGALYCSVKQGTFDARLTPQAQSSLGPWLHQGELGYELRVAEQLIPIASDSASV